MVAKVTLSVFLIMRIVYKWINRLITSPQSCQCQWRKLYDRIATLRWRHNGCDSVSNHQPDDCLLNRLFSANQRKHQSSASLAFVRGIHRDRWIPRKKGPVTRKMVSFDDVIATLLAWGMQQKPTFSLNIIDAEFIDNHKHVTRFGLILIQ